LVLFATLVLSSPAAADDLSEADRLFVNGRQLLTEGKPAEACAQFERAIHLAPNAPVTMLNLGTCNDLVGRLKTALSWFRKAQLRAIESQEPDVERLARERTVKLAVRVPTASIVLSRPDLRPQVTIDNVAVELSDFGRVELDAGDHVLEARLAGFKTIHERFEVQNEARRTLTLTFEPATTITPRSHGVRWLGITGLGLLAMGTAVAAYEKFGIYDPARDRLRQRFTIEDRDQANNAKRVVDYVATPMLVGGVVALGVATFMWLRDREERRIAFAPLLGPDSMMATLTGTWP